MRNTSFDAERVSVEVGKYDVLIFCAHEHRPPMSYLRIQRLPDGVRKKFGDIHFEWCGQGYGAYDVIGSCDISGQGMHISLKDEAAEEFDGELRYVVRWSLRPDEFEGIRSGLRQLFRGTRLLKDEA